LQAVQLLMASKASVAHIDCGDPVLPNYCSLVTYNMHGFNQGKELVMLLCNSLNVDFILLQEHWLSSVDMSKLHELSADYMCYGVSAMDTVLSENILKGRPYGGVAIMVRNKYFDYCKVILCAERLVAVSFGDVIFVNVYFPCSSKIDFKEIFLDLMSQLRDLIDLFTDKTFIIGGDFNLNFDVNNWSTLMFKQFMVDADLCLCNELFASSVNYTYCHESLGYFSYVDYFIMSRSKSTSLLQLKILEDEPNLSDHLPVFIAVSPSVFNLSLLHTTNKDRHRIKRTTDCTHCFQNRWDKANLLHYYDLTRLSLQPIFDELVVWESESRECGKTAVNAAEASEALNKFYSNMVHALLNASFHVVPRIKVNSIKFWWDEELKELKEASIASNKLWIDAGRPSSGPIFEDRKHKKYKYKLSIREKSRLEKEAFSNDLHNSLMEKDQSSFWKCWKSKSNTKSSVITRVGDVTEPSDIAEGFAKYFSSVCTPEKFSNEYARDTFKNVFDNYRGDSVVIEELFSVELLDSIITAAKKGKAAGLDGLSAEHVQFSHPVIVVLLRKLFICMLRYGVVPDSFGRGLTIPLPKTNAKSSMQFNEFRGITISPVVSKIFEHCVLSSFSKYFGSSDTQFGFKKGLGCNHAIYSVRQVVDYYTSNGSTVSVCTLDISKAFDKVNYFLLLSKLMNRNLPKCIICILLRWYTCSYIKVKWGNVMSSYHQLHAGFVRGVFCHRYCLQSL
jgi:exonuclease III